MSITKEEAMAYKEVTEVLKYTLIEDVKKIPKDILEFYRKNMDVNYNFKIDTTKPFEEQKLLEKTKMILAILFRDYWATEVQKEKIKQKELYDMQKIENEKKEKYQYNDLFSKKERKETQVLALTKYEEEKKWYNKLYLWIKSILSRRGTK